MERTSTFFQAAFKGNWKEGQDGVATLPEDDADIVQRYLHFVYTGRLAVVAPNINDKDNVAGHEAEYLTLFNLHIFGDKYKDIQIKNAVVKAIIEKGQVEDSDGSTWFPGPREVDVLYKSTQPGSFLRKLVVDIHVGKGWEEWLENETYNPEFLADLVKALMKVNRELHNEVYWDDGVDDPTARWRSPEEYLEAERT